MLKRLNQYFTKYEKIWLTSVMGIAILISILFPENDINGTKGYLIACLYLLDTLLNIVCELLISKQSRYNFIVSLLVEIVEIITCIVLKFRFATLIITLLFWIPVDIVSYINWSNHRDQKKQELTVVRKLKTKEKILVIISIIIWTIVVGYILSGLNINTDFIQNKNLETILIYLDACTSAIGVINGIFILLRLHEQWLAWYIYTFIDATINIITGQYILLVLKVAFLTNTTYGYIKWNKYINNK